MGVEFLLIDSKSTTIQGFISTHFLPRFKEELKPNTIYKLNGFSIRPSKSVCRVSPHKHGISFNNKTTFAPVHEVDCQIDSQHFRIRDLQVFTDIVDKHTDLLGEHFLLSKHYKSLTLVGYGLSPPKRPARQLPRHMITTQKIGSSTRKPVFSSAQTTFIR
ncbi:hypothetical protein HID58_069934 [Brassica napus]|uniref:Replication protein A 70 kDa DNA-binding subunit B/D first OB fold domain-containing protein n=2 Tax=Brassica napus TaxID=3708 RepID=A0ABQ7YXB2_BRANA|nr:hypothetical protein HID58_069934 [Brassica napus]CDY70205.1 BnaCnng67180D [Brassica napus]